MLDTLLDTTLGAENHESGASLPAADRQENQVIRPLLAMLKKLHSAATIVVFVALVAIASVVLCTEDYADSGILTLKVCHLYPVVAYCKTDRNFTNSSTLQMRSTMCFPRPRMRCATAICSKTSRTEPKAL